MKKYAMTEWQILPIDKCLLYLIWGSAVFGCALCLVTQLCPTLCNSMDCTVYGIIQARTLEWVVVPSLGDLPDPGIEPRSPALQVDSLPTELSGKPNDVYVVLR